MKPQMPKIENFTSEELRLLIADEENFRRGIYLFACYQISAGKPLEDVAAFYAIPLSVLLGWVKQLNEGGIEGLNDNEIPLMIKPQNEQQQMSIREIVRYRRPLDYGFNSNTWKLTHLVKLMLHQFQISYRLAQLRHFFENQKTGFLKQ